MRNKKKLNITLAIILGAVWGTVGYNVWAELNSPAGAMQETQPTSEVKADPEKPYRYVADARDPFTYYKPISTPRARSVATMDSVIWIPPPFRLCAVLGTEKGLSAVLEDQSGQVFVVSKGDTLGVIRITEILGTSVCYFYNGRRGNWDL